MPTPANGAQFACPRSFHFSDAGEQRLARNVSAIHQHSLHERGSEAEIAGRTSKEAPPSARIADSMFEKPVDAKR